MTVMDSEYKANLADAIERLRDLALPENVGAQVTPEDQAAFFTIIVDYRLRGTIP